MWYVTDHEFYRDIGPFSSFTQAWTYQERVLSVPSRIRYKGGERSAHDRWEFYYTETVREYCKSRPVDVVLQ